MALTKLGVESLNFASYYFIIFTCDKKWPKSPLLYGFPYYKEKDYG